MLTRKSSYALRALCRLALAPHASMLASEIAAAEGIPKRFLEGILHQLTLRGLLVVRRGRQGGYTLSSPPEQITAQMVIAAVDGALFGYPCLDPARATRCQECPGPLACGARAALSRMVRAADEALGGVTLAELCRESSAVDDVEPAAESSDAPKLGRKPARYGPD